MEDARKKSLMMNANSVGIAKAIFAINVGMSSAIAAIKKSKNSMRKLNGERRLDCH